MAKGTLSREAVDEAVGVWYAAWQVTEGMVPVVWDALREWSNMQPGAVTLTKHRTNHDQITVIVMVAEIPHKFVQDVGRTVSQVPGVKSVGLSRNQRNQVMAHHAKMVGELEKTGANSIHRQSDAGIPHSELSQDDS